MKKLLAGGATLAFAAVGAAGFAAPGGAQDFPDVEGTEPGTYLNQLEAAASPETAAPGSNVAISSVENCNVQDGYTLAGLAVDMWPANTPDWQNTDHMITYGFVPSEALTELLNEVGGSPEDLGLPVMPGTVNGDGSFEMQVTAPSAPGEVFFFAECWQFDDSVFEVPDMETLGMEPVDEATAEEEEEAAAEEEEAPPQEELEITEAEEGEEGEEESEEEASDDEGDEEEPPADPDETFEEIGIVEDVFVAAFTVAGAPAVGGTPELTG